MCIASGMYSCRHKWYKVSYLFQDGLECGNISKVKYSQQNKAFKQILYLQIKYQILIKFKFNMTIF